MVRASKMALVSFLLNLAAVGFFVLFGLLSHHPLREDRMLGKLAGFVWLFGGLLAVGFAIAGCFSDDRKIPAVVMIPISLVCWAFTTIQVLA